METLNIMRVIAASTWAWGLKVRAWDLEVDAPGAPLVCGNSQHHEGHCCKYKGLGVEGQGVGLEVDASGA